LGKAIEFGEKVANRIGSGARRLSLCRDHVGPVGVAAHVSHGAELARGGSVRSPRRVELWESRIFELKVAIARLSRSCILKRRSRSFIGPEAQAFSTRPATW
jgi:hypothetical protein